MTYTDRHINRLEFPDKWGLILEDDVTWQVNFLSFLKERFGDQSKWMFLACPAPSLVSYKDKEPSFILLDHDMPWGNGPEFMEQRLKFPTPVCAVSGIPANNQRLMELGASFTAKKGDWNDLERFFVEFVDA